MTDANVPPGWVTAVCPECGAKYLYPKGGYKPSTCNRFECVQKHLHPELKIKGGDHGPTA